MSEKRHFKVFASRYVIKDKSNYIKLFDAICKQKEYDELALLKREKYIRQLPTLKNRLYELIVQSLRNYHDNSSVEMRLNGYLHTLDIFFRKELYDQCDILLAKAKQLAEKYGNYWYMATLLKWEIELLRVNSYCGKNQLEMKTLYQQMFTAINHHRNIETYSDIFCQLYVKHMKEGYPRNDASMSEYKSIMQHSLLRETPAKNKQAVPYRYMYSFYQCRMFYCFIQNDYLQAIDYAKKLIALVESYPYRIAERPGEYIYALHTLIVYNGHLGRHWEILPVIQKLKNIPAPIISKSEYTKNDLFTLISTMELGVYISNGEFDKGVKLIAEIENKLKSGEFQILDKQSETDLNYNIACIYFSAQNYTASNQYLQKVLNDTISDLRTDYHCFSRILSLLVQFELGKRDLLEYTIKSTYRYLHKRKHLYKLEVSILNFIRNKLPSINSQSELLPAFSELKTELEEIFKNPFENKSIELFDFVSWLESKIEGRAFAEVVREKAAMLKIN